MKKTAIILCTVGLALLGAGVGHGATIDWDTPAVISGDTDVSTDGTKVLALAYSATGTGNTFVNGVQFLRRNKDSSVSGITHTFPSHNSTAFGEGSSFTALSANYQYILDGALYNSSGNNPITFTGLTIGTTYQVQLWALDCRANNSATAHISLDGDGTALSGTMLDFNDLNDVTDFGGPYATNGIGSTITGTFVADAATQTFRLDGFIADSTSTYAANNAKRQVNALQLRLLPDISIVTPSPLNFGYVVTNTTRDMVVVLTNVTPEVLNITNFAFDVTGEFDVQSSTGPVAAFGSTNITVRYAPTNLGPDTVVLTIESDAPSGAVDSITLTGTAVAHPPAFWHGGVDGNWDTTTTNWTGGTYTEGALSLFPDTGAANLDVTVQAGGVSPAGMIFTDAGSGNHAYSFSGGAMGGTGALALVSGFGGSVALNATNSYSGGTTLSDGTLAASNATALGTGALTLEGGVFKSGNGLTITNAINVTGTSQLSADRTGGLTLSGDVTGSGTWNFGGNSDGQTSSAVVVLGDLAGFDGTIAHDAVDALNSLQFNAELDTIAKVSTSGDTGSSSVLRFDTNSMIGALEGSGGVVQLNGSALTVNQTATTTFAGLLDGMGSLVKTNSGMLTLSFANTYSAGTTLTGGTLAARNADALGTGTLTLQGGVLRSGNGLTIANDIAVAGTSQLSADQTGNLWLRGDVTGSGTWNFGGSSDGQASTTVVVPDNLDGFTGTIAHNAVNNRNNLTLSGGLNTTAKLFTSGGTGANRQLNINVGGTVGGLEGTGGKIQLAATTLTVNQSDDTMFAGLLANSGNLVKANSGALTLTFNNTYTGTTTVNGGMLVINGNQTAATGAVTVDAAGTLCGSGTVGGATTVDGALEPGSATGSAATLSFGRKLTLRAGATTTLGLVSLGSHDVLNGDGVNTLNFHGDSSLVLDFAGSSLAVGDMVTVFTNWANLVDNGVAISTINPVGRNIDTSMLFIDGTLTVKQSGTAFIIK